MNTAQKVSEMDDEIEELVTALEERWRDGQMLLRAFPREATIRGSCPMCGLERVEQVGLLVDRYEVNAMTLTDLGDALRCERPSCKERLDYRLE
ncbi:hypothetical protein [Asticcacaulis sp. AND118]|uniref:hypothetical protein n=1 Tax=Asticcacaulis sp. AND118 TaxID=2840468 RepID=UPI001D000E7F|nr:hypothetical protein [Asticcacaulis sp. AND118]UDF02995.1 hypothetical protein LH365_11200 [Asticcacaulis sp. AND118]